MFSVAKAKRQQQMFSVAKAKRQLQSAQSERKSTTRYGDEPKIANRTINIEGNRHIALDLNWYSIV